MPALVLGLASTAVVAVAVASVIDHDDDPTATAPATTQTTAARPEPDVFDQIEYGVTDGEQAVSRLRAAGFTVFDYVVCSNSIDEPGLLRQVRLAGGGAEIVGADGTATSAADLPPGTELDVLVSSGEPCD